MCFVVRLAGLRVCGVGAKGCSSHVARAHFAFRSSWLAGARVVVVRRVSRRGFAYRAQATTIGALRGIPSSAIVSSSGIATGLPF